MQSSQVTIVDSLPACRSAVASLDRERLLAVDSEGVHLSRTGPLTLLQVATSKGHVFLFDIFREPRMFKDGGLKRLLENAAIVKVLHSAKNDAEALHWQHEVELKNVHDTQVAHQEIERSEGHRLPPRGKLSDVCAIYWPEKSSLVDADKDIVRVAHQEIERSEGHRLPPRGKLSDVCAIYWPEKSSLVDADKDIVRTKMNRTDGEYWAKRPLTQEMIDYAASDVIALIPEVYTAQKRVLEEKGLMATFRSRVERELSAVKDNDAMEALRKEKRETILSTLREAAATVRRQRFQDITDENVLEALSRIRLNELSETDLPPVFRDLKLQQMKAKLDEVEQEMNEKGKDYDGHTIGKQMYAFFTVLEGHPMKEQAQRVLNRVNQIILEDIRKKYTNSTPTKHVAVYEKRILSRELRPRDERDPSVHPVLLRLYWMVKLEDLEEMIKKFRADPQGFQASQGYVKMLKFYTSGDVPARLKEMGRSFLKALEDQGKVRRPQQASGMRMGSAKGHFGRRY